MYWFSCVNDASKMHKDIYLVALKSAILNTSLNPILIYDGNDEEFCAKVSKCAKIIKHRSLLYNKENFSKKSDEWKNFGGGAYLRIDIPLICKENNITDQYVLYTDTDVLFLEEVVNQLNEFNPTYFSICAELQKNNYEGFNSGVMLINVENMYNTYNEFVDCIESVDYTFHTSDPYDQAALQYFYNKKKVDRLPLKFNYKPCWGISDEALIIHYHGPKRDNIKDYLNGIIHKPYAHIYKKADKKTWNYFIRLYEVYESNFYWKIYLDKYPDLRIGGVKTQSQAIKHWYNFGIKEGRSF